MEARPLQELINAAAGGERAALDELLVRHMPDLRAYVRLRAGGLVRAREGESDLVQSVLREVLKHAGRFQFAGEDAFRAWLFATALRKLVNKQAFHLAQRRDAGRMQHAADPEAQQDQLAASYARFASPSQAALSIEELGRIERAFAELPEDYREVILLSRIVALPRADVAREMGRSESSVRNLLHRALAQLARLLEELD